MTRWIMVGSVLYMAGMWSQGAPTIYVFDLMLYG